MRGLVGDHVADALELLVQQTFCLLDELATGDGFLVVELEVVGLVIERLVVVFVVELAPDLVPLTLALAPLFVLELEAVEDDGDNRKGMSPYTRLMAR